METDHQPLISLIQKTHPPGRLLHWALALQEYKFTMIYIRGQSNIVADALSQMEYQVAQVCATNLPLHQHQIKLMQQQDTTIKKIILQIQASHDAQLNRNFIMIDMFCIM